MWPAAAPAALSPCASVAPAANAAAFLAAPARSTPVGSSDCSQTTPARMKSCASDAASSWSLDAATRPAPALTISCACAGPPTTATRDGPNRSRSSALGAAPSGGTRPLASEMTGARVPSASVRPPITPSRPRDGTARKTSSARPSAPVPDSMRSSRGRSTPGRYFSFSRASDSILACASVRATSVVRRPARTSRTATAVPNEPAPMTTARRPPGTGKGRLGRRSTIAASDPSASVSGSARLNNRVPPADSRVVRAQPEAATLPVADRWVGVGRAPAADLPRAAMDATPAALDGAAEPRLLIAFVPGTAGVAACGEAIAAAAPGVPIIGCAAPLALRGRPAGDAELVVAAPGGEVLSGSPAAAGGSLREAGAEAAACLGDVADRRHQALLLFVETTAGDPQDVVRGAYSVAGAGIPLVGGGAFAEPPGPPVLLHGTDALASGVVAAAIGSDAPLGVGVR